MHYRSTAEEAAIVEPAGLLLQIELDPVVKASDFTLTCLSHKHVLKATRVHRTVCYRSQQVAAVQIVKGRITAVTH